MNHKKAQAWGFDIIVATGIFIVGIIAFFLYTINYPTGEQEKLEDLLYEGNTVANSLLSEGYPLNWTTSTVSKIGLLTENKIDQTKLEYFNELATTDYARTKSILGTKYNYFINFSRPIEISGLEVEGIGFLSEETINSIKVSRVSIYQNKPISLEVQVWE
ncbi:MAG: hypothetical protein ACP5N7_04465 [Candidatus Pacearchaeota archaeon]